MIPECSLLAIGLTQKTEFCHSEQREQPLEMLHYVQPDNKLRQP
jgi:hypothetical protein